MLPVNQRSHYPFGEDWYASAGDKWRFTSYERDGESGNDYAMARYYVNRLSRFNSPDPIAGARAEVTLAWTTAFADANCNVTCDVQDSATGGTAQGLVKERLRQITASLVSMVIFNPTAGALTGPVFCTAVQP